MPVPIAAAAIPVDTVDFLIITLTASVAAVTVTLLASRITIPVVIAEIVLGIAIGPDALGWVDPDSFVDFFANLGLGMLFYFAGYELDLERIKGKPVLLGALGWLLSLALAYTIGGVLAYAGVVLSLLYTGSAMSTTAIGTLIPILDDARELPTRFGTFILAAGATGEFGPILLVTLFLSLGSPLHEAAILLAFIVIAVIAARLVIRTSSAGWQHFERTLESSNQLPVRVTVALIFALVALASELGLDLLLGGFAAGIITRLVMSDREAHQFESKLFAVGYGFLVPFFFVVSGIRFDLDAVLASASTMAKVPLFLALMLVIRGTPALLLYRGVLPGRDRLALAFLSSAQLPLVVAITTIAVGEGHMRSSTAAALVGAAILSTLIYPLVGLRLREGRAAFEAEAAPA
jgi:Kef-type K+ transport system membrane component KefB